MQVRLEDFDLPSFAVYPEFKHFKHNLAGKTELSLLQTEGLAFFENENFMVVRASWH